MLDLTSDQGLRPGTVHKSYGRTGVNRHYPAVWHDWKTEEYSLLCGAWDGTREPSEGLSSHTGAHEGDPTISGSPSMRVPNINALPRELLHIIVSYLDVESELSLRFCCRHLYRHVGLESAFSLMYKMRIDKDPDVRLAWKLIPEWLPILSRKPTNRLFCCGCKARQPRSMFCTHQAMLLPSHRRCRGYTSKLCVSPELRIGFEDLKIAWNSDYAGMPIVTHHYNHNHPAHDEFPDTFLESSFGDTCSSQPTPPCQIHLWYNWRSKQVVRRGLRCWTQYYFLRYLWSFYARPSPESKPSLELLHNQMNQSVVKFCPHFGSNDPRLSSAINALSEVPLAWKMNKDRPVIDCGLCATSMRILLRADYTCNIEVTRSIGPFMSPVDPQWLEHLE